MKCNEEYFKLLLGNIDKGWYMIAKPNPPVPPHISVSTNSKYSDIEWAHEKLSEYMKSQALYKKDMEVYGRKMHDGNAAFTQDIANSFGADPQLVRKLIKMHGEVNTIKSQREFLHKIAAFAKEE